MEPSKAKAESYKSQAGFRGLISPQGESTQDVYMSLDPQIRQFIDSRPPNAKQAVLDNMRSMMPAERNGYGMSLVKP